jgi:hypothetical protein
MTVVARLIVFGDEGMIPASAEKGDAHFVLMSAAADYIAADFASRQFATPSQGAHRCLLKNYMRSPAHLGIRAYTLPNAFSMLAHTLLH